MAGIKLIESKRACWYATKLGSEKLMPYTLIFANASSATTAAMLRSVAIVEKCIPVRNVPLINTIPTASVPTASKTSVREKPLYLRLFLINFSIRQNLRPRIRININPFRCYLLQIIRPSTAICEGLLKFVLFINNNKTVPARFRPQT